MRYLPTLRHLIFLIALACTACGTALPSIKPFKLDIQQGNVVTSKMLLQLRPGMTKSQVVYIMGSPLIQDSFHGNRWDYVYQMHENGKVIEQRRVILDFDSDLLSKVRGDVEASKQDKSVEAADTKNIGVRTINPNPEPAKKGLLDKLKFWKKDATSPVDTAKPAEDAPAKASTEIQPKEAIKPAADAVNKATINTPSASDTIPAEVTPLETAPAQPLRIDAPAEAGKSILSVPLELPSNAAPVVESAPAVKVPAVAIPKVEPPKVAPPSVEPIVEQPKAKAVEQAVDKAAEKTTTKSELIAPTESKASADSKTPTESKDKTDLPAENSPSFFDRMLEKIGF
ncbi:MAG: outer membrane protein assembly factor BamE [Methylophilaceae bacterium]